jgi:aminopeptidase N
VLCARDVSGFVENTYSYCGDPFLSDCANYSLTLELPKEYTAATSGKLISEKIVGSTKTDTFTVENARDFAIVLSDKFSIEKKSVNGVEVMYYFYSDDNPTAALNVAAESLEYYDREFGEYVYPTLSVVQTGFCYGGMEYTALEMISDNLSKDDSVYTIAHETAHQWWYEMVGSDQINCGWQDEGLAEMSSVMFFENYTDYGFTRTGIIGSATKSYRAFYSVYSQIFGNADTTMNRPLSAFESEYEYTNIAYNKGLILFDTLRTAIGQEKFLSALKSYYTANLYKIATYEELISCFLKEGDTEGLFNSFIQGKIVL